MFYAYVNQLPMVNDELFRSNRESFECKGGRIYKGRADDFGNRSFVIFDSGRDVVYRATKRGLHIQYGKSQNYVDIFIPNREVRHIPFTEDHIQSEVNNFVRTIRCMSDAFRRRKSLLCKVIRLWNDHLNRYLIIAALAYGTATALVLFYG
ncbi:hypothetical protein [Salmonella phage SSBI34]|nr:hypothetical protein [Salmonella phage SSBI34]